MKKIKLIRKSDIRANEVASWGKASDVLSVYK